MLRCKLVVPQPPFHRFRSRSLFSVASTRNHGAKLSPQRLSTQVVPTIHLARLNSLAHIEERVFDKAAEWSYPRRTRLELTMLDVMNSLTDKPSWASKIRDPVIRAKWQEEMKAPLGEAVRESTEALVYDLVRDKDCPWQVNREVVEDLGPDFVSAEENERVVTVSAESITTELLAKARDFDKDSFTTINDLGHADVVKSDTIVPEELKLRLRGLCEKLDRSWGQPGQEQVRHLIHPSLYALEYGRTKVNGKVAVIEDDCPGKFQWLPAEVVVMDKPVFTSGINGLEQGPLYEALAELLGCALPMWKRSIAVDRYPPNRIYVGDESETMKPGRVRPMPSEWVSRYGQMYNEKEYGPEDEYLQSEWASHCQINVCPPPEPYETWRERVASFKHMRDVDLENLQVIVKISGIHLTPGTKYAGGSWHVEGLAHEHICATAVYYYDSCNVQESSIAFRAGAALDNYDIGAPQDSYAGLERVYDTNCNRGDAVQRLPSVVTREGRLLTFPNVFQHCVSPFELEDPSKPGHRKVIVLWLVNPQDRIVSTADVPSQELSREERIAMQAKIVEERSVLSEEYGDITETYNFCEH